MVFIHWNASPELFSLGFLAIRWYGLLFMSAFVVGFYIMKHIFTLENRPVEDIDPLSLSMGIGTVLGARLGHCLFYEPSYYLAHPLDIFKVWQGGLASHGAIFGIVAVLWFYSRSRPQQPMLWLIDRLIITIALAGFFIRTGNLFNSEIVGKPTDVPWAFIFDRLGDNVPRHPTQIYEAVYYLCCFFVLFYLYKKTDIRNYRGRLLGYFFIMIFGFRFFIEFFKDIQVNFEQGMQLNMGQILSIPVVLAGLYFIIRSKKTIIP